MRRTTALTALAAGLALAGCSQASGETVPSTGSTTTAARATASPTPVTYELDQTFTATTSYGAELTVELPAEGPSDAEQLRQELNIDPISYARVHIDNRQGTQDVSVYAVTLYDEAGTAYEFTDLSVDHIADWGPDHTDELDGVEGRHGYTLTDGTVLDEPVGEDLDNRQAEVHDKYLDGGDASKRQVNDGWLASTGTELPERITGITIQPNGMGEELPMSPGGEIPTASAPGSGRPPAQESPAGTPAATVPEGQQEATPPPAQGDQLSNPVERPGELEGDTAQFDFTYDEAYRAWQSGMAYYEAFCVHYQPTTDGGRSQCEGIEAGTVDRVTGEYIGP